MSGIVTYWLSPSKGAETKGPFTLDQLQKMYDSGLVTAQALVCPNGSEDWIFLHELMGESKARAETSRRRTSSVSTVLKAEKRSGFGCLALFGCAGLLMLILIGLSHLGGGFDDSSEIGKSLSLNSSVKSWMRSNLADGDAEIMGIGDPVLFDDSYYRIVRLRGKNSFGGPVVNDYVAKCFDESHIVWMKSLKDFRENDGFGLGLQQSRKLATQLGF